MSARAAVTPIVLVALATGAVAYAYLIDQGKVSDADRAARRRDVFPSFRVEDVRRIAVDHGAERLVFEREEGYFLGAMYISYALSCLFLGLGMLAAYLIWPELDLGWAVLIAAVAYLPFVPAVFRSSRVLWIYLDRWLWPDD